MISRRVILKAGLGATALFLPVPFAWVWAQTEGTIKIMRAPKVALTIGNGTYPGSPLKNPVNDARAMGSALRNGGFEVTTKLDAPRSEIVAAVQAYTQALAERQAVGVFYFAGHGLQLAWRNYMVPVDARLSEVADIQTQCVELGELMAGLTKARNPLNIIILDACRDNPFGSLAGANQKGLSQMDAPLGTLLAYATAPGNVASDGEGANGLYTENLLREIAVPEAKVEDVFKRVRLQVRRSTSGRQIPWESTSLEEDFYFVPSLALASKAGIDLEGERRAREEARKKQSLAEAAERKRKVEEARKQAQLAAEEAERKRKEYLAVLERQRLADEVERKRKQELALQEAQRATQEGERNRLEDEVRREAQRAQAEAERHYQEEFARREQQRLADEAERKRREDEALREAKRAEEEAERRRKEDVARREAERQRAQQSVAVVDPKVLAERQYQEELAVWEQLNNTSEPEPFVAFLLRFPSGRFSELAQFQLDRVLARKGENRVEVISDAKNPYSKGTLRVDTAYKVGDVFRYRVADLLTGIEERTYGRRVTAISDNEVIFNDGAPVTDLLGNPIRNRQGMRFNGNQFFIPEYSVGKRWIVNWERVSPNGRIRNIEFDLRVIDKERITVPAGTFEAFRIEGQGWTQGSKNPNVEVSIQRRYWVAAGVRSVIARELVNTNNQNNRNSRTERHELVSYSQN